MKTRMNIPKADLLLELGWEPILDFINRQKDSYYKRLLIELPDKITQIFVLARFFDWLKYCYKYCYSDSRKLWAVMKGGGLAL
jgi:hypothetical protein